MTTPSVRLRPATPDDAADLIRLEQAIFGVDAWSAGSVAGELTEAGSAGRWAAVATAADRIVGYAVVRVAGDFAELQRIAVAAEHRRTGVARALLTAAREAAALADRLLLEVSAANDAARLFYAANGFEEIDRRPRYYRDGSDALVLQASPGTAALSTERTA